MDLSYISLIINGHRIEIVRNGTLRYDGREVANIKFGWRGPDKAAFTVSEDGTEIQYKLEWNDPWFESVSSEYVKLLRNDQIVLELK